jgi:RimJ/RimL family protein N-acetyltransferase
VLSGLHLKGVRAETLRAIEAGRSDWASLESGVQPTAWPQEDRRMPGYRVKALDADPTCAPYLLHLVLDQDGRLVGRIGCHAGPDADGEVEIGYFVLPSERGQGIAGYAVDRFLEWLQANGVTRVRATVGPDNEHSRRILERRGFVETGSQVDDEDGLELVYHLDLSR